VQDTTATVFGINDALSFPRLLPADAPAGRHMFSLASMVVMGYVKHSVLPYLSWNRQHSFVKQTAGAESHASNQPLNSQ
jgi:hypothetical protein